MMKFVLMSLALVGSAQCLDHLFEKMMKQTARHVLEVNCWGESNKIKYDLAVGEAMEKCLLLAPSTELEALTSPNYQNSLFPSLLKNPFKQFQEYQDIDQLVSLWRNKRDTGLLDPDQDDFLEFIEDFRDFKGSMASKIGNLTCVLMEMKMLTPDFKVNIEEYTKDRSEDEDFELETPVLQDPEWWARLHAGYQDCYDISESLPSAALDDNPLTRTFGRQMIFFKCAEKNERMNCALGAMKKWVETFYGDLDSYNGTEYGLPSDSYEAAGLTAMVMENSASDEEKFVSNFFWGPSKY